MDQKIKRLFDKLQSRIRNVAALGAEERERFASQIFQLQDAVEREHQMYEAAVTKAGPSTRQGPFWEEPAGQDILRRAMAADPVRTEHDLIALGAHATLTVIAAQHQAELFRKELPRPTAEAAE